MVVVKKTVEEEITLKEFVDRVFADVSLPKYKIGDVVLFKSVFVRPTVALITGILLQNGMWVYNGVSGFRGVDEEQFFEKDILGLEQVKENT